MFGINTNVASLFAQNNLNKSSKALGTAIQRLSSGLRVNGAKDDAAGLAIAERFTAQIRGEEVGKRNTNDGISLLEVADGALSSITDSLQRMRELAVQSANGTLSSTDRANLDLEFKTLSEEINRVADTTEYNGLIVLGSIQSATTAGDFKLQIGADTGSTLNINLRVTADSASATLESGLGAAVVNTAAGTGAANFSVLYTAGNSGESTTFNIQSVADSTNAIRQLDKAIDAVTQGRARVGSGINRLDSILSNLDVSTAAVSGARGRILDADFAKETAALTRAQILQQAGTSVLAQANQLPSSVLSLLGR
jgi:flagellin